MTVFSVTDAAFEGFRLTWEKPKTLLIWTGFFLGVNLLIPIALFATGLNTSMAALETSLGESSVDSEVVVRSFVALAPLYALLIPVGLSVQAMIAGAVFRLVLSPEESRRHPVQFGIEEFRLVFLNVIYVFLAMGALIVASFIGGIIGAIASAFFPNEVIGNIIGFIIFSTLCIFAIRMSLGQVMTFAEGKLCVFESWSKTKNIVTSMLLTYMIAITSILVVYILLMIILTVLITIFSGGDFLAFIEKIRHFLKTGVIIEPDMNSFSSFFTPGQISMLVFGSLTSAVFNAVMSAPAAVIYREIRAQDALR